MRELILILAEIAIQKDGENKEKFMSKWLTIEERANAKTEKAENKAKIKALRREIYKLQQRNKRLNNVIYYKTYKGHRESGVVNEMFGKSYSELTTKEKRVYNRTMKRKYREK